ncbi:MAG: hypothetical protein RLZZ505_1823 [Verrucomicrobiota bacterium]|jgi:uncharacterized RDD family membrane protein YckC
MEIWLIVNGKRSGPYPDYDIRSRIEHGEMSRDEMVWHEGLPEWTPVGELELFRNSIDKQAQEILPPPLPEVYLDVSVEKPKPHLARRFWARWTDLTVYSAFWWLGMYLGGRDIGVAIGNLWLLITLFLPWFAIEAWLIHRFGTTPGKWLMGLKVSNEDGSRLVLKESVWRSLRVMITGVGFGWGLLSVLCQAMSWFTTRRLGKPIWDYMGNHKVVAETLKPLRIVALVFLFVAAAQLQMAVRGPHEEKIMVEQFPQYKEFFERSDKWYFPERK